MDLPFGRDEFFAIFARYNEALWPAPVGLTALAVLGALLAWRPSRARDRLISAILAVFWAWMGLAYHYTFFRSINPAAVVFAAAFVAQAVAFLVVGLGGRLHFRVSGGVSGFAAGALLVYALAVYPLVGQAAGHAYPAAPTFGLPCPTTIFTLGMLIAALPTLPRILLIVPLAWCAVGTVAAVQFGVVQDYGLPVAGLVALIFSVAIPKASSRAIPVATTRAL